MEFGHEIRRWLAQSVVPAACFMLVAYFTYHMIQGDRGLIAMNRLELAIDNAQQALTKSEAERARLEAKVAALRPDSLDLDMLDERAREVLGLVRQDELVVFLDDGNKEPTPEAAPKTAAKRDVPVPPEKPAGH